MTFHLLGAQPGECDDSVTPTGFPCELEEGWSYLYRGIQLWNLVDPERAASLQRLLKEDVEREDEAGHIVVTPELAQRVVDGLRGLDQALLAITDAHYRVRPEMAERVRAQAEHLVDARVEDGQTVYTLANTLHDVRRARRYLEDAIALGRAVEFE